MTKTILKLNIALAEGKAVNETTTIKGAVVEMMNVEMIRTVVAGVATEVEMVARIMDRKYGVTVPVLEAALAELGVPFKKSVTKEEKAVLFVEALDVTTEEEVVEEETVQEVAASSEAAVGETPVADKLKEVVEMTPEQVLREIQLKKNEEALQKSLAKWDHKYVHVTSHEKRQNPIVQNLMAELDEMKDKFLRHYPEFGVVITGVELFERPDRYNRLGKLYVRVPRGYMDIKIWNNATGEFEAHDFADYSLDAFYKTRFPREGSGDLTLAIKEGVDGKVNVRLPKSKGKNDTFYDIVLTKNIRVPEDKRAAYGFNNVNLEAALSAFLQVLLGEFVQQNPKNRHGFNESCMSCQHMVYLGTQDSTMYDVDRQDKQNTAILNQLNVEQLSQNGQYQPQALCTVFREFVDKEGVEKMNYLSSLEKEYFMDEEGQMVWPTKGQVVDGNKIVSLAEMRRESTENKCASCPFYHKIEKKADTKVAAELLKGEGYVSKYYADLATVGRQVVETMVNGRWNVGFPGEFEGPENLRVKGLGGVVVYTTDDVIAYVNPEFLPAEEAFDAELAAIESKISQMFYVAFNMRTLDINAVTPVIQMALNKPEGLNRRLSSKWDSAVHWLQQGLLWAQEAKAQKERVAFTTKFFTEEVEGAVAIELDEIMLETLVRAEYGSLDYSDVWAHEFGRFLDEEADELVYDVIASGGVYYVVGGTEQDRVLAAGGLQAKLQSYINNLLYGVRRDADAQVALQKLKATDEVKTHIASLL